MSTSNLHLDLRHKSVSVNLDIHGSSSLLKTQLSRSASNSQKWISNVINTIRSPTTTTKSKFVSGSKDSDLGTPEHRQNPPMQQHQLPNMSRMSRSNQSVNKTSIAGSRQSSLARGSTQSIATQNEAEVKRKVAETDKKRVAMNSSIGSSGKKDDHKLLIRAESDDEEIRFSDLSDSEAREDDKKLQVTRTKSDIAKVSDVSDNTSTAVREIKHSKAHRERSRSRSSLESGGKASEEHHTHDIRNNQSTPSKTNGTLKETGHQQNRLLKRTATSTASLLTRNYSSTEALRSDTRLPPHESFGTSVSVKRTEMKVDEIKSIIEQQEAKLARYGRIIEQADTRIRDRLENSEIAEERVQHKMSLEMEAMLAEIKAERGLFQRALADAVRELKVAQTQQENHHQLLIQTQQDLVALTQQQQTQQQQQQQHQQLQQSPTPQLQDHKSTQQEFTKLHEKVDSSDRNCENLSPSQLSAERETNAKLNAHITEIQQLSETQSDTIRSLEAASKALEARLRESLAQTESLTAERDRHAANAKKFLNEATSLRDEIAYLEASLEKKKAWVLEHKRHLDDYRTALAAAGLTELMGFTAAAKTPIVKGGAGKTETFKKKSDNDSVVAHPSLEEFVIALLRKVHDFQKQIHRHETTESKQSRHIETLQAELEKRNAMIREKLVQLDTSETMAESLRGERDYAISKIKDTIKVCKKRETQYQTELDVREKGVLEVVETSNHNLKVVREGYEAERAKFKQEIQDLLRENMSLDANLRAATKEKREMETELATVKKQLQFKNTEYLLELGINV